MKTSYKAPSASLSSNLQKCRKVAQRNFETTGCSVVFPRKVLAIGVLLAAILFSSGLWQPCFSLEFTNFATRGYEGKGEGEFLGPEDLLLTASGEIVVSDSKNNRIQIFKVNGQFERMISLGEPASSTAAAPVGKKSAQNPIMDKPVGLAFDSKGRLFVSSSGNHRILILNFKTGELVGTIGKDGKQQGDMNTPMDIAIKSDDTLAVADSGNKRVQLFDSTGKFQKEIHYKEETSKKGFQSLPPRGVCWLPGGELAVTYSTFGQVTCWDANGNIAWRFGANGTGKGELREPSFLVPAPNGNILVSDSKNNRIVEITSTGLFVKSHSGRGTAPGKLLSPRGLALNAKESLFVADQGNNRVSVLQPSKSDLILQEAKTLIETDKWDDALPKVEAVLNLDPTNAEARTLMVNALHFFGDRSFKSFDFDRSEEFFRRVLIYNPNDLEVQSKLDAIFWAVNKDLIMRIVFGIIGLVAALLLTWVVKSTFNRMVFGHA